MNTTTLLRSSTWLAAVAALALALLASCGGGGVGSGGTGRAIGFAAGTVNGFGSVIVDGVAFDDRTAPVVSETAPGVDSIAEVKLGHRVSIEYETSAVASVVRLDGAAVGPVTAVGTNTLTVLGQTIAVNANGLAGPITQFGNGYTQIGDVGVGDAAEIHGVLVRQGAAAVIQATRIDKLAVLPTYLRVTGMIAALGSGSASTFTLGQLSVDASAATIVPTGTTLAVGTAVTVLAPASSLSSPAGGGSAISAAQVRARAFEPSVLAVYLSGSLASLDASAQTFTIEGQLVRYAGAAVTPAGTTLANGLYVRVRGRIAADGALVATDLAIRDAGSDSEAELHGDISALDPATAHFVVRGVTVDSSAATLSGCPPAGLTNGLFVEVHGSVTSTGVRARTVQCESESSGSVLEREGRASAVDTVARTFTLTASSGTLGVSWTDATFFGGVTPSTLSGQLVQVEGSFVGNAFVAAKVKVDD